MCMRLIIMRGCRVSGVLYSIIRIYSYVSRFIFNIFQNWNNCCEGFIPEFRFELRILNTHVGRRRVIASDFKTFFLRLSINRSLEFPSFI